ncbi:MAG: hypothetical protein PHS41_02625 [Victivallaceae bacterium]|nr:hypothetical protein [Victivallaceae bacterium]
MDEANFTADFFRMVGMSGGYIGVGLAAIGSALGAGIAGTSAIGAWKKRYAQNKTAPFTLMVLAGAPLSQTIYALVLLMMIKGKLAATTPGIHTFFYLTLGIFAGLAFLVSAWYQGRAAAAACDAYCETDQGFANYLIILGVVETVAIFALAFAIMVL